MTKFWVSRQIFIKVSCISLAEIRPVAPALHTYRRTDKKPAGTFRSCANSRVSLTYLWDRMQSQENYDSLTINHTHALNATAVFPPWLKRFQPASIQLFRLFSTALSQWLASYIIWIHYLLAVMRYYRLNVHMSTAESECLFRPKPLPCRSCYNISKRFLQRRHNPFRKTINTVDVIKLGFFRGP